MPVKGALQHHLHIASDFLVYMKQLCIFHQSIEVFAFPSDVRFESSLIILYLKSAPPFIWVWNWILIYAEWLVVPFYYGFYGNAEALYFSTGWSWVFQILSGMLILLLSYVTGSAVIAFACYRKKEWCVLSLRVAYCTLLLLAGTPLSKVSPFNLVLMFFIIQLLGQLIIQAGDVVFRHGRHWRKWL